MKVGMQLLSMAGPYLVQYLGDVKPQPHVNVDQAFEQAEQLESFKPWDAPSTPGSTSRALFIGINYFGTRAQLSGCCNDVRQMLATLQKKKFALDEVRILVDEKDFPGRNGEPTRDNIASSMAWLAKNAKPGDVLFVHYSGHGVKARSEKDTMETYDQCLVPLDHEKSGCIRDDDIFQLLVSRLPQGVRLTALFDCCHSGSLLDLPYTLVGSRSVTRDIACHMQRIREGNDASADVMMISGCTDEQTSADVQNTAAFGTGSTGAGGAATQCLTYTLLNKPNVTYQDMLIATREMLRKKKFTQVPQLSSSKPVNLKQVFSLTEAFQVDTAVA